MLQTRFLKPVIIFTLVTYFNSCGLLQKTNKTQEKEVTEEITPEKAPQEEEKKPESDKIDRLASVVKINTTKGSFIVRLYKKTPLHQKNFTKLIHKNYYDGTLFHRVIKDFMIQGGDPNSRDASPNQRLGNGGPGYTIPAEFVSAYYHKKGALCAARQGDNVNPKQESSGSQFYIVTGAVYSKSDLEQMENRINQMALIRLERLFLNDPKNKDVREKMAELQAKGDTEGIKIIKEKIRNEMGYTPFKYTPEQIEVYTTEGGAPFLDNNYTVFGEVLEGMDIVEAIGNVPTNGERPQEDIKILSIEILE